MSSFKRREGVHFPGEGNASGSAFGERVPVDEGLEGTFTGSGGARGRDRKARPLYLMAHSRPLLLQLLLPFSWKIRKPVVSGD